MNITKEDLFNMYCQEYITPERYEILCNERHNTVIGLTINDNHVWLSKTLSEEEFNNSEIIKLV